ncbi:hypothetical protein QTJ16_000043 [Diplocarpon rosae]|uniref:Uncharacterized protein n=1 Tax=Diplocarpon rosae TaxID=946125 RepID=A0AAD9WGF9_9HELO|nr:hypothetical protein QTJ16_000043 [Diplocarpon rosae]
MALPMYQSASSAYQAGIAVLAPYLDVRSLNALSQVNWHFNRIFCAVLWENPVKYIAQTDSHPFTKFIKLYTLRPYERCSQLIQVIDSRPLSALTHSPKHFSDYVASSVTVSCELIFQQLHHFDHVRFLILDSLVSQSRGLGMDLDQERGAMILLLSLVDTDLANVDYILQTPRYANLVFLDISGTCHDAVKQLEHLELENLRILKLCRLRLTAIPNFVLRCAPRLWSLDLSRNLLVDVQIRLLLRTCLLRNFTPQDPLVYPASDELLYESPPTYLPPALRAPPPRPSPCRRDHADHVTKHLMQHGHDESDPMYIESGLTNLALHGNKLTSDIIPDLLTTCNRLQVLDVGTVRMADKNVAAMMGLPHATLWHTDSCPLLAPSSLEHLRIHHSFITHIPTITVGPCTAYRASHVPGAELFGRGAVSAYDPLRNYRLARLGLTGLPTKSAGPLIQRLLALLRRLALQEQRLRDARAGAPRPYRAAPLLSGLRVLTLQLLPEREPGRAGTWTAVTGDGDVEVLGASAARDFSFFGAAAAEGASRGRATELRDVVAALKHFRRTELPRWNRNASPRLASPHPIPWYMLVSMAIHLMSPTR